MGRREDAHVDRDRPAADRRRPCAPAAPAAAWPAWRGPCRRSRRGTACRRRRRGTLPARSAMAPVKAPRTWPNSWLSSSSPGMAAQLTATNGLPAAAAVPVDGARDDLLAGAGLAGDQHGGVAVGEHADGLLHLAHRRRAADQLVLAASASRRRRRALRRAAAACATSSANRSSRPIGLARWSTAPRRIASMVLAAVGTAVSTATGGGVLAARAGGAAPPCRRGRACAGRAARRRCRRAPPAPARPRRPPPAAGVVAEVGQRLGDAVAQGRVVVDDQDAWPWHSRARNTAPSPGRVAAGVRRASAGRPAPPRVRGRWRGRGRCRRRGR